MDVYRKNFREAAGLFNNALEHACMASIDLEFSGLTPQQDPSLPPSVVDSVETKYRRMADMSDQHCILQAGISLFSHDGDALTARTFNFNLFPDGIHERIEHVSSCLADTFVGQMSSIRFLARHGFDFNKCIANGIRYMTLEDERMIRSAMARSSYFSPAEKTRIQKFLEGQLKDDKGNIQMEYCRIWLAADRSAFVAEAILKVYLKDHTGFQVKICGENAVKLIRPSADIAPVRRNALPDLDEFYQRSAVQDTVMEEIGGFRMIMDSLVNSKIPIVGHNCLTDLTLLYQHAFKPLPKTFDQFVTSVHNELFHEIWDTKHIILQAAISHRSTFKECSSNLSGMYSYILEERNALLPAGCTVIHQAEGFERYAAGNGNATGQKQKADIGLAHEAGFDAWMTGVCFIRLSEILSTLHDNAPSVTSGLDFRSSYLHSVRQYRNCVNMIRGPLLYIDFERKSAREMPTSGTAYYARIFASSMSAMHVVRDELCSIENTEFDPVTSCIYLRGERTKDRVDRMLNDLLSSSDHGQGIAIKPTVPFNHKYMPTTCHASGGFPPKRLVTTAFALASLTVALVFYLKPTR